MDLSLLEAVVGQYSYGLDRVCDPAVGVRQTSEGFVFGPGLYSYDASVQFGLCHELAVRARKSLASLAPTYTVFHAVERGGAVYSEHHFLLMTETSFPPVVAPLDGHLAAIFDTVDALVVDPSHRLVAPLASVYPSEYTVARLLPDDFPFPSEHVLRYGHGMPLGWIDNRTLVALFAYERSSLGLFVQVQGPRVRSYDLGYDAAALLDQLGSGSRLSRMVLSVREKVLGLGHDLSIPTRVGSHTI